MLVSKHPRKAPRNHGNQHTGASRLKELAALIQAGHSNQEIIGMMGFDRYDRPENVLQLYRRRLDQFLLKAKLSVDNQLSTLNSHCGKRPHITDGEIVCTGCGVVLGQVAKQYTGLELEGRSPINALIWDNNLGTDDKATVIALRRSGFLKRLNSSDLKVDDEFSKRVKLLLARKAKTRGLDYSETDRLAKMAMKRVKEHLSDPHVDRIVDETWNEFQLLKVRIRG